MLSSQPKAKDKQQYSDNLLPSLELFSHISGYMLLFL
jgi:hypothetical protein